MLLDWKDKHFPQKLDAALDQQAGVMTKLRKVVAELDLQATTVQQSKGRLDDLVKDLDAQIAAAQGNQDQVARLTALRNTNASNALNLDTKLTMVNKTKAEFEDQLTALEAKHKTDTEMAIVLKSEWQTNRELKDLPNDVKKSYDSMINLGQDADRISREITEREAQSKAAIDEALKHGVPVTGT
jgi:16S rRNA G1207 methylase RsmC